MTVWSLVLVLSLAVWPVAAQLPPSGTLSDADRQSFQAEVARIEALLISAPDKDTVTYQMARTWAAAKQWPEAMQWLRKVAERKAGFDPSRDAIFAELRGAQEFGEILAAVREATPAVSHSKAAFQVAEGDLVPESVAYDARRKYFYFGSMGKGKVIRCSTAGKCMQFASGLGTVLGLKAQGNGLWLLSNSDQDSALIHYDLASARVLRTYTVAGPGHEFNDLAIAPSGDVYLTDTRAGAVWHLANGAAGLTQFPERFEFANGITLSPDGRLLYVSTFPDGITVMDLKTHGAAPIARPPDVCLATIDGLYFHQGALIAIQNGFMSPRVVRLGLTRDLRAIERFQVLERRNPLFEGVTTGVVAGGDFFYMANIQDGKKTGFNPITILKLRL
ncbi:MAG TPA: SMP-30/gluconolactonase/LRE family protein [Bryobacteraceae bacterium]|nr:SMP-30/gluconolactonase/LRE family protein [Bryobacteraceae bacterium]